MQLKEEKNVAKNKEVKQYKQPKEIENRKWKKNSKKEKELTAKRLLFSTKVK